MQMNPTILLLAWWVFVGIVGYALFAFMRMLSNPNYRTNLGDISTEVGYSTDPYGVPKDRAADGISSSTTEEGFMHAAEHNIGPGM